jgi:hypothetical protein
MTTQDRSPLSYLGVKESNPPNVVYFDKDPVATNIAGFDIGDFWVNTVARNSWQLLSKAGGVADWQLVVNTSLLPLPVEDGGTGASTLTGVLTGNGTSAITGSAITQYGVLFGGAANAVSSLGAGTAGQVVQSGGAGANPAYSTATYPLTTAQGDLLSSTTANAIVALAKDANATRYLSNTGANNNAAWAQVNLTNGVTGILPIANGGTNANAMATANGVTKFDGTRVVTSAAMTLDAANRMTNTAQPCFAGRLGATILNVTGNGAPYTLGTDALTLDVNQGGYLTAAGVFTAPVTGVYYLRAIVHATGCAAANFIEITLTTTGRVYTSSYTRVASANDIDNEVSAVAPMNATDTATVAFYVTGEVGNTVDVAGAAAFLTGFSGFLIC